MEENKKITSDLFEHNAYYKESLKWYNAIFVEPKTQLVMSAGFCLLALSAFVICLIGTLSILPLTEKIGMELPRPFNTQERITLASVGNSHEEASISYVRYLIGQYTRAREEYIPSKIEQNFYFVVENSSEDEFYEYQTIADPEKNPNHPVWQYGSQTTKRITPKKVTIKDLEEDLSDYDTNKEYTALVNFVSNIEFADGQKKDSKEKAEVKFKFMPIIVDQDTAKITQLPKLIITDYKLKE